MQELSRSKSYLSVSRHFLDKRIGLVSVSDRNVSFTSLQHAFYFVRVWF